MSDIFSWSQKETNFPYWSDGPFFIPMNTHHVFACKCSVSIYRIVTWYYHVGGAEQKGKALDFLLCLLWLLDSHRDRNNKTLDTSSWNVRHVHKNFRPEKFGKGEWSLWVGGSLHLKWEEFKNLNGAIMSVLLQSVVVKEELSQKAKLWIY